MEELHLDTNTGRVQIDGVALWPPLTLKESQLLRLLYERRGEVVTKDEIARQIWEHDVFDFNAIDALVFRVRRRIEPTPGRPRYLLTRRGVGYVLVTTPARSAE